MSDELLDTAERAERAEAERDSLRCPNCDKLRLELGEQRQRAERAEAERDALRIDNAKTGEREAVSISRIQSVMAENERIRVLLNEAYADNERLREAVRERDSLRQHLHDEHQRHIVTMDERDALRALLREARQRVDTIDYCSGEEGEWQFWEKVDAVLKESP